MCKLRMSSDRGATFIKQNYRYKRMNRHINKGDFNKHLLNQDRYSGQKISKNLGDLNNIICITWVLY